MNYFKQAKTAALWSELADVAILQAIERSKREELSVSVHYEHDCLSISGKDGIQFEIILKEEMDKIPSLLEENPPCNSPPLLRNQTSLP